MVIYYFLLMVYQCFRNMLYNYQLHIIELFVFSAKIGNEFPLLRVNFKIAKIIQVAVLCSRKSNKCYLNLSIIRTTKLLPKKSNESLVDFDPFQILQKTFTSFHCVGKFCLVPSFWEQCEGSEIMKQTVMESMKA